MISARKYLFMGLILLCTQLSHAQQQPHGQFLGAETALHPQWFKQSFLELSDDIEDAGSEQKLLVVYFWQDGCPYCSQLWKDVLSDNELTTTFIEGFDVVALNMWGDREVINVSGKNYTEKQLARALNVQFTPSLLFYTPEKEVGARLNGYIPPKQLLAALKTVKAGRWDKAAINSAMAEARQEMGGRSVLTTESYFHKTANLRQLIAEHTNKIAVLIEQTDCLDCDTLHDSTLQHSETKRLLRQFTTVQWNSADRDQKTLPNGDKTTVNALLEKLEISYLPAFVFFNEQGKVVFKTEAQLRNFHTQSAFDYAYSEAYLNEPNFQRWISDRAEQLRAKGEDVDIWAK